MGSSDEVVAVPSDRRKIKVYAVAALLFLLVLAGLAGRRFLAEEDVSRKPAARVDSADAPAKASEPARVADEQEETAAESAFSQQRRTMIEKDLRGRDITDPKVLRAMGEVPRHRFVPDGLAARAYADHPLPIGHGQTISQPYIVALMTQLAQCSSETKALDIGTGSGYQAAILAEICKEVYSIEIVDPLAKQAKTRLAELGYDNVHVRSGDGYRGWPEHAPFDAIVVAAAPKRVPQPLVDQLAPGGRLVIPVGDFYQELLLVEKQEDGTVKRTKVAGVAFVPMTGEAEKVEQ